MKNYRNVVTLRGSKETCYTIKRSQKIVEFAVWRYIIEKHRISNETYSMLQAKAMVVLILIV